MKSLSKLKINRIFSCTQILVVVNATLSPEARLIMQDFSFLVNWRIFGSPQNTVGMMRAWWELAIELWVILVHSTPVVIPVDRHCERVGDQGTMVSCLVDSHEELSLITEICRLVFERLEGFGLFVSFKLS